MWEEFVKENISKRESTYVDVACKSKDAIRLKPEKEDLRPAFSKDADRIIYSLAYSRYMDKTQVFSNKENDHITKRMTHVQMVSKVARMIGRSLGLNEDLIEAAALGHDLGHTPYGHEGEYILDRISMEVGEGHFHHNIQSVRDLMCLEKYGEGLNITLQVLDAIMCHNGEFLLDEYRPMQKDIETFQKQYEASYQDHASMKHYVPMTLEGCVVRVSDIIAYLGRDIEDAIRMGLLNREDVPSEITDVLGLTTSNIVNTITMDIIKESVGKPYLRMSKEVLNAVQTLKKFNEEHIYRKANTKEALQALEQDFRLLFQTLQKVVEEKDASYPIVSSYLKNMSIAYQVENTTARIVIDYIAGMTDDFFKEQVKMIREKQAQEV